MPIEFICWGQDRSGCQAAWELGTAEPPHEGARRSLGHAAVPQPRRRGGVSRAEPAPFIQEVKATSGSMKTSREPGGRKAGVQEGSAGARGAAAEREGGGRWGRPGGRRAVPAGDVRASRPPSIKGRPPAGPLRAAGSGRRAAGPRLRSSAAGAGPGGCAAPGSEAWRGFCTSGPTISQVRGGRRGAAGGLAFGHPLSSRGIQFHARSPHPTHCPSWGPFQATSTGSSRLRTILRMGHHQNPALPRVPRKQYPVTLFDPQ